MNFSTTRLNLTLLLVALYMLLDAAFMLVRIPPGSASGMPFGEILILVFFLTIAADLQLVKPFFLSVPIVPLLIWWFVGVTQLSLGFAKFGMLAMRDGTSLIESSFLWIGFAVCAAPGALSKIMQWFKWILILSVAVTLTYPFRTVIASVSPVIFTTHMVPLPLFFGYHLPPISSLVAAMHLAMKDYRYYGLRSSWFAAALMVFIAVLFQQRTIYLLILFLLGYMAVTRAGNPLRLVAPLAAAVVLFLSLIAMDVPIPGRISQNVSIEFYLEHFFAIGGQANTTGTENQDVVGAAGGVNQRFFWWRVIWEQVTSTWTNLLFGLGYGVSLVGLARDPGISLDVREPHNSLMSALGRTGFVGLAAYVWLHVALAVVAVRTYVSYRKKGFTEISYWILLIGAQSAFYWIAGLAEDAFEKPFISIPYYFFFGVILNLSYRDAHIRSRAVA